MGSTVRHLKLTLLRAKDVNACTSFISGKSRTKVTVKALHKNLVYTTNAVEDMGQNPAWERNEICNVFHFDYTDESEYITLEVFNRNNDCIGVSKLHFSDLGHLMPGKSEKKTLPVMVRHKSFGELVLDAEILEQQATGDLGLLTLEIRKGLVKNITSIFGSKTTKISAKLTYKHATYKSGDLLNMGNKFLWHEDNIFTFIINSDHKADDILRLEVYNYEKAKVGEREILMSLFVEQEENLRRVASEGVQHSIDLCLPIKGVVGNIDVTASFTPKPRRSSFPQTQHQRPPLQTPYLPRSPQRSSGRSSFPPGPSPDQFYPPVSGLPRSSQAMPPEFYPPLGTQGGVHYTTRTTHLQPPTYTPSAPVYNQELGNHHSRGSTSDAGLLPQDYQDDAHGAPATSRDDQYSESDAAMMKQFMQAWF